MKQLKNVAKGSKPCNRSDSQAEKKWLVAAARLLNRKEVASGRQLLKQKKKWLVAVSFLNKKEVASGRQLPKQKKNG